MTCAILTEELSKRYRSVHALSRLSLRVESGTVHALVGPNGAGKTTLIKILMNIAEASSGQATVLGLNTRKLSGKAFSEIGYVSENQELPGWMRVGDFLAYLRPFYPSWDTSLEEGMVHDFDLPLRRKLKHLSRGMQMKAALASSLAFHPKLIVLDEPFSGLDPLVRDELAKTLLQRASESTIFVSSHDLAEVEGVATHVTFLEKGTARLSEDLTSLRSRFREVEVTLAAPPAGPPDPLESWLQLTAVGAAIRFVESAYHPETTAAEIQKRYSAVEAVKYSEMSLRAIFLALAKAGKDNRGNA